MPKKNELFSAEVSRFHAEEEMLKKTRPITTRLDADLKQLFEGHFLLIPLTNREQWAEIDSNADILVTADPSVTSVDEVREFLRTEPDIEITSEGTSPVLNNSYHAFYLRIKGIDDIKQ